MKPMFSPSLMCTDLLKIRERIQVLNPYADFYHTDTMDGHFVKNITLSSDFVETVARVSRVPLGCHLMVTHLGDYITVFARTGAAFLSPHVETINTGAFRILHKIHELGCRAGIVLDPVTPLFYIRHYLHLLGKVTTMSADPDFVGQAFTHEVLDRIKEAKALKLQHGYQYLIEVGGSYNATTFQELRQAGVEMLIVGNSGLFRLDDNLHTAWEEVLTQFHGEIDETQHL